MEKKTPNTPSFPVKIKEIAAGKQGYIEYHYSDGTTRSTKGFQFPGRPKAKLENGATLVSSTRYVPEKVKKDEESNVRKTTVTDESVTKRTTILVYADGERVQKNTPGRPRPFNAAGAALVGVTLTVPPRKQKAPKAPKVALPVPEKVTMVSSAKKTVLVYADGTEVQHVRGKYPSYREGYPILKVISYFPEKKPRGRKAAGKEEVKAQLTIPDVIPDTIEVGKVYFHNHNGAEVKVLQILDDEKVTGEFLYEGKLISGNIRKEYLRG